MKEHILESRIPNGPVILTDTMQGVRSATLGFFFRKGARHEPAELNGISHFIEHAVFKGTRTRTALQIAIEQDRLGGNLDAFTSHEETGFAIKVIDDQLENAFGLIADLLIDPSFALADLKSEQKVIIEEMKMVEDSPEDHLADIFNEAFFPGHPLGLTIAGTPATVKSFTPEITRKYHNAVFNASNLIIAAAGNIEHGSIVDLTAKAFSAAAGQEDPTNFPDAGRVPVMAAPIIIKQNQNLEQAHLVIAAPLVSATDERRYAADLLASVIGGGTSSRLWQKIREERGLAYSVGASATMYLDCGLFAISAATSPEQVGEVVDISMAEIRDVVHDGINESELDLAKQQAAASILLGLEDSALRTASLVQNEITHGHQLSVDAVLANINAVTVDDCERLAQAFFKTEKFAFAAMGDLKGLSITREHFAI